MSYNDSDNAKIYKYRPVDYDNDNRVTLTLRIMRIIMLMPTCTVYNIVCRLSARLGYIMRH